LVPDGNGISYGAEGADAEVDEDVEGALHILPFPPPSVEDDNEGLEYGNPQQNDHSHAELPDFTDIDSLEQDDYPSQTEQESAEEESTEEEGQSGRTSFETDPDPESTTYCSRPHSADKPIVQYALTIDAGSTGSRIHVYKFHNCGPSPTLEYETFKAIQPGLSSFARDPTAAAASLDPLMEEALRVVPESLHKCSPVEVKATAGLRLLPGREGQAILDEVRQRLEVDYPFSLSKDESAVEIMDGKDEGVYAWITANYLLGKIGSGTKESSTDSTMAVMDLGGASTQIVFEPQFASTEELAEGDHKYALSFGGRDFVLYQHSYLGYGLMRARRSVHNLVAFTWSFLQPGGAANIDWDELNEEHSVPNPCLATGTTKRVELDPPGRKTVNVTMLGVDGGFESCNRVVELVMAKDA
jgi:guanosine-diphosphatase